MKIGSGVEVQGMRAVNCHCSRIVRDATQDC